MLIDWFTVGAQILNFLVLVYLLKRFLYKPIIRAMDEREKKIAARLEEADRKRQDAEQEVASYRDKNRELDDKREEILNEAKEEAENRKRELVSAARTEAEKLESKWKEAVQEEIDSFLKELRRRTGEQVCEIARKALSEISNSDLQKHMIDVFLERLKGLDQKEAQHLSQSAKKSGKQIVITSAFEIATEDRKNLTRTVHEHILKEADVSYDTLPGLVCGIRLKTDGQVISWNLDEYLRDFQEETLKVIQNDTEKKSGHRTGEDTEGGREEDTQEKQRDRRDRHGEEDGERSAGQAKRNKKEGQDA